MSESTDIIVANREEHQLKDEMKNIFFANVLDQLSIAVPSLFNWLGTLLQQEAGVIGSDLGSKLEAKRDEYRR